MKKIRIRDKEYNCSNMIYYHILGLESENRLFNMEIKSHEACETLLQQKIDKAIEYIKKYTDNTNFIEVPSIELLEILGDKE